MIIYNAELYTENGRYIKAFSATSVDSLRYMSDKLYSDVITDGLYKLYLSSLKNEVTKEERTLLNYFEMYSDRRLSDVLYAMERSDVDVNVSIDDFYEYILKQTKEVELDVCIHTSSSTPKV